MQARRPKNTSHLFDEFFYVVLRVRIKNIHQATSKQKERRVIATVFSREFLGFHFYRVLVGCFSRSIHVVRYFVGLPFWLTPFRFCLLWLRFYSFGFLKPIKHATSNIKNYNVRGISSPQSLMLLVDSFPLLYLVGFLLRLDLVGFFFRFILSLSGWFIFSVLGSFG